MKTSPSVLAVNPTGMPPDRSRAVLVFLCSLAFLVSCSPDNRTPPLQSLPVSVVEVTRNTLPVQVPGIGAVEPYSTVSVKTQIGGELQAVHLKEGEDIKTSDLLAVIDSRPYQAALKELKAKLEKDRSLVAQAKADLEKDTIQARNAQNTARRQMQLRAKGDGFTGGIR